LVKYSVDLRQRIEKGTVPVCENQLHNCTICLSSFLFPIVQSMSYIMAV